MTIKGTYPAHEFFYVKDTIGVPHPYCITPKHVEIAADQFCGMLGKTAMEAAEKQGARCGVRGCNLSWDKHEQALLIGCKKDIKENEETLRTWLLSIKDETEKNGYAGFAFLDETKT
jgi:hypothetical protein